jgi:hypothetical protein
MESRSIAIHTVKVLDHGYSGRQLTGAVWTPISELLPRQLFILLSIDPNWPAFANPPAEFVKAHANELVCHVRLRSSRGGAQLGSGISHFFPPPRNQLASAPSTSARALSS